jgi:hypothetical protein
VLFPPAGAPRPNRASYDRTVAAIDRELPTPAPKADSSQVIATPLATVLWNSSPDVALLKDSGNNSLQEPAVLESHAKRMLADTKSSAFVERFFITWLQLDQLSEAKADKALHPATTPRHQDSRNPATPIELWSENYTFLNGQLAKHYGVSAIKGPDLRRYPWNTPERAGLIGQGSIQAAAHGTIA